MYSPRKSVNSKGFCSNPLSTPFWIIWHLDKHCQNTDLWQSWESAWPTHALKTQDSKEWIKPLLGYRGLFSYGSFMQIQTCLQDFSFPLPHQAKGECILIFPSTKINCSHWMFLLIPPAHSHFPFLYWYFVTSISYYPSNQLQTSSLTVTNIKGKRTKKNCRPKEL